MARSLAQALTITFRDGIMVLVGAVLTLIIGGVTMSMLNKEPVLAYQESGVTVAWIPPTVRHWDKTVNEMAKRYDLDANLVAIIMTMESGGNPKAKSEVGATGLMQLMPATAGDIAKMYVKEPVTKYDLTNPRTNIEFGTAYLAMLRDQYGSQQHAPDFTRSVELIATAYNAGFGAANALEAGEGLRDTQPVIYSRDAFNMYRERVSKTSPTFDRWKERGGTDLLDAAVKNQ